LLFQQWSGALQFCPCRTNSEFCNLRLGCHSVERARKTEKQFDPAP
jgi:hypothetical protein